MLTNQNCKAYAVLSILIDLYRGEDEQNPTIEAYENGREHGFHIINYGGSPPFRGVSFSENRNSDDIVVYCGTVSDFSMQGNVPSDELREHAKFFRFDDYLSAAKAAFSFLTDKK